MTEVLKATYQMVGHIQCTQWRVAAAITVVIRSIKRSPLLVYSQEYFSYLLYAWHGASQFYHQQKQVWETVV